jgi:hypothetical protein
LLFPLALLVLPVAGPLWRSRLACRSCGWTVRLPFRVRPEIVIALTITAVALVLAVVAAAVGIGLVVRTFTKMRTA